MTSTLSISNKYNEDLATEIRSDFSIFTSKHNSKPLVYLDNGATTHKPRVVINRISDFMNLENGTVRRGLYELSAKSTALYDQARETVQNFINANSADEIIFTRGTTESLNLLAYSYPMSFLAEGDEIIISEMEHHANIVPWQMAAKRQKLVLKFVPLKDNGELDLNILEDLLKSPKAKLLSVTHLANSLGTINPIKEITQLAKQHNVRVIVDGAQSIAHISNINVCDLDIDFYVFSGHKLYGPTGIGILYGKLELLNTMHPYHGGGEMIEKVSLDKTTYANAPRRFEAGTPAIAEAIGLAAAIDYLKSKSFDTLLESEHALYEYALTSIQNIEGINVIGQAKHKTSVISFTSDYAEAFDIGTMLNEYGIAIRTGHHCAQPVMNRYGLDATARISLGIYNTKADIDFFIEKLTKIQEMFK